jgi:hypothetical protein
MKSRKKYKIDNITIEKLLNAAGLDGIMEITPKDADEFYTAFTVKTRDKEYIIKIAPTEDVPVMTCEKGLMASEMFWYNEMKKHTQMFMPEIYYADFKRNLIPVDYFIMEKPPGQQLDKMNFSEAQKAEVTLATARMMAQLHNIRNNKFGYIQNELYDDWYQAIRSMVKQAINDCVSIGKSSKRGESLLLYIDYYKKVLEKAECSMVNFNLWEENIICSYENGKINNLWINFERSFWGDRMVDFIFLERQIPLHEKIQSLSTYNLVSDKLVGATREERIRYAVAQGYLGLIMETEKYFRYTPFHSGWWRKVFISAGLYQEVFKALKK